MAETKIIYHIDEEETPYLVKIPIAAENITLLDFKQVLNKPNYKFFFKSMDQDFGWAAVIFFSSSLPSAERRPVVCMQNAGWLQLLKVWKSKNCKVIKLLWQNVGEKKTKSINVPLSFKRRSISLAQVNTRMKKVDIKSMI